MFSFNKDLSLFVLPDLRQIQFNSVRNFFERTLPDELKRRGRFQIRAKKRFRFQVLGNKYWLEKPGLSEREAVHQLATYASNLYIPAYFIDTLTKQVEAEVLCVGSIPLISPSGTFVINGVSRCLVSQMLRTPGIYFTLNVEGSYIATIICNSGRRLRIELDQKDNLYVRITKKCKVSIVLLLVCMGLNIVNIPLLFKLCTDDINALVSTMDNAERNLQNTFSNLMLRQRNKKRNQTPSLMWQQIFVEPYDLGYRGRLNVNKNLYANCSTPKKSILLPQDLIIAAERLTKNKSSTLCVDDIDDLSNKYVKSVGNVMSEQFKLSWEELKTKIVKKMYEISSYNPLPLPRRLVGATPLTITFNQFFGSYALSQFLDQTNPLSDMAHKRKLSALGPGGLTPRTATFRARDIHPSQYGRICPVETAEGQNSGVVTSFTVSAQIDFRGSIQHSSYSINNMFMDKSNIRLFSANNDKHYKVTTGSLLSVMQNSYDKRMTPAQYKREFVSTPWNQIDLRNILPVQYFSVGVTLIPFLEHNDATRALMGSNMQRQAVPLINPETPTVGTGLESQVALDSGHLVTATNDAYTSYADGNSISYRIFREEKEDPHLFKAVDEADKEKKKQKQQRIELLSFQRSNNKTCIHQRPIPILSTKIGAFVKKGQLLADGAGTRGGELALGKNVLVAYMPWEGYNFEDSILISERLVYEDIFTSFHIERYEVEKRETIAGVEKITSNIPHIDSHLLRHLDKTGIVSLGAFVHTGDVLVGKLTPQYAMAKGSPTENKLLHAIFGAEVVYTIDSSFKVPQRADGRVIDIRWISRENSSLERTSTVYIYILQKRRIQIGDKVAGRHGNKGIISRILPRKDMPYLQDGTPVDMVLSPLGVPSRMNVGQILECLLGLAGKYLNQHYRIMPFDERYEREASRKLVFSELYNASEEMDYPWLFEYNHPGKSRVFDGRTGDLSLQHITIGQAYMLKLIHQADDKIHARSVGPYTLVTQQPLKGKSRRGGQRVGEMEVWALQGFGAAHVLQEMLLVKSDHVIARSDALRAISEGKIVSLPRDRTQDSLKLLLQELRCLAINIDHITISQKNLTVNSYPATE